MPVCPRPRRSPLAWLPSLLLWALALCTAAAAAGPADAAGPGSWTDDLRPLTAADWNRARAAHLLERAGFGGTPAEVDRFAALTPQQAVARLVRWQTVPDPQVRAFEPSPIPDAGIDPFPPSRPAATEAAKARGQALGVAVKPGGDRPLQPVVNQFFFWLRASMLECNRIAYWWAERMLRTERPLVEKMALFWHGHFATHEDKVRDHRKMRQQLALFQQQGLGNFRSLVLAVAQDPAMLAFLDAGVNVKGAPNENFAREILEMFTLGVGHYSEADIREAARAFTGWNFVGTRFVVNANQHDDGPKTVFGQTGRFSGEQVVDLILQQPRAAEYIATRLYQYFVREDITPATAQRLGALLRAQRWELAPLMEAMFLSRDFYAPASVGTRIKPPVELVVGTYRKLGLGAVPGLPDFNELTRAQGQHLLNPPTVAGWAQGRAWVSPGLLIERGNFVHRLVFPDFLAASNDRAPLNATGAEVRAVHERLARGLDIGSATRPASEGMAPGAPAPASGAEGGGGAMALSNRLAGQDEAFNTRYGSYRGWQRAVEVITPIPRTFARLDLAGLVLASGAASSAQAVDHLVLRFFSVAPPPAQRAAWADALTRELGTADLQQARGHLEDGLRQLLHLMLSSPDYQLG